MAKQTPPQYLRQHEDILSERDTPLDPEEMNPLEINENGKRKASTEGMRCANNIYFMYIVQYIGQFVSLVLVSESLISVTALLNITSDAVACC